MILSYDKNQYFKMAAAAANYKRILQLLEKWPVDKSKSGRDLGEHLRIQVTQAYKENKFENNSKYWDQQYLAIQRLLSDEHYNRYPRLLKSSATGLSGVDCHIALSNEFLKELEEQEEPYYKRFIPRILKKDN